MNFICRSHERIDNGEWHTIQVRRRKRMGFISVDGHAPVRGVANSGAIVLRTNSKLWIGKRLRTYLSDLTCVLITGGMPSLPAGLPSSYYKGFEGCIHHIMVNAKPLDMLKHNDSGVVRFCHDNEI